MKEITYDAKEKYEAVALVHSSEYSSDYSIHTWARLAHIMTQAYLDAEKEIEEIKKKNEG